MFKRILAPTDGSPFSGAAFDCAVYLAQTFGKGLVYGLSVIDVKMLAGPFLHDLGVSIGLGPFDSYQPKVRQMLREKAELALQTGAEKCEAAGVEFEKHLVEGVVSRQILERSQECDLVVMGKLGEHAEWRSSLLGHNVEAVTRAASRPVVIMPDSFKQPEKALLAYDGSTHAYNALHSAGELASRLQIPLVVLSSHPELAQAEKYTEAARRYLNRCDAEVDTAPCSDHPEECILKIAEEKGCDFIIMGAYGQARIQELILGSTTEQVMRRVKCPILLHR